MKKALLSMTLMGLLTATGSVLVGQQQEREQPRQGQQMSAEEVFARLDADSDGKLSEAEFSRAHAGASDQDKKKHFSEWDADGDGSISEEEFTAKYSPRG